MNIRNKLRIVNLSELSPYKNNAKIHSDAQIELVKKSLEDNDYYSPIIVDAKNVIVAGHSRFEALKLIDPSQKIEVVDVSYLKPKQIKKLRILDNKIVSNDYDADLLQAEIESLYGDDPDFKKIADELSIDMEKYNSDEISEDLSDSVKSSYEIIIECESEQNMSEVYEDLNKRGLKCRISTL